MTADTPDRGRQWIFPVVAFAVVVLIFVVVHLLSGEEPVTPLERGLFWLAEHQKADGAWRGEEIAVLRPGPAMTAFVLYAFTRLPEPLRARYAERMNRAVKYLQTRIDAGGIVGLGPDGPDYPNYATSLTVLSFVALKPAGWEATVARMVAYLKGSQFDESEGWNPEDPEYGGWAFGGLPQPKPNAHRLDISMTRFALEALAAAAVPVGDPVWTRARKFLETCQNHDRFQPDDDGGFFFTPLTDQSKAGEYIRPRAPVVRPSYGSATADGLIALRCAGASPERIQAAAEWIQVNFTADRCPGFAPDFPRPWAQGLRGYWMASVVRGVGPEFKSRIATAVAAQQRPDGSWVNPEAIMLENEPILATTLAVLALAEVLKH